MAADPQLLWRYVFGHQLAFIHADGCLRPSDEPIARGARPVLLLSSNHDFEWTSVSREVGEGGASRQAVLGELANTVGVYRFAAPKKYPGVMCWADLRRRAGIPSPAAAELERAGLAQGAIPSQWFGSLQSISLAVTVFEKWTGSAWVAANLANQAAVARDKRVAIAVAG